MIPISIPQIQGVSETFWKMRKTTPQWVCTTAQKNESDTISYFLNSIQNTITEKGIYFSKLHHIHKRKVNATVQDKTEMAVK
jgi:precorrin-4 methylase